MVKERVSERGFVFGSALKELTWALVKRLPPGFAFHWVMGVRLLLL